jgi:CheY-like chemotaxis protein
MQMVEDEALICLLIVDELDDLGCHVLESEDGLTALRISLSPECTDPLVGTCMMVPLPSAGHLHFHSRSAAP